MVVFLNVGQDVDLMNSAFLEFLIALELFDFNNLDCILLIINFVNCSVNFTISSFSNNLVQSVVLNDAYHLNMLIYILLNCKIQQLAKTLVVLQNCKF